jgi:hypothetical protein
VITHPDQARALLVHHPQLAYALFQALVLNKIVDAAVLQVSIPPRAIFAGDLERGLLPYGWICCAWPRIGMEYDALRHCCSSSRRSCSRHRVHQYAPT